MTVSGGDKVIANLVAWEVETVAKCAEAMDAVMTALEGWAKTEHAYTDRTGNNTLSIRGFVAEATPRLVKGYLTAGMNYSVFLELARDGRWAFLMPVIERHESDIRAILKATVGK